MENIEKIEKIREKAGVTYEEAKQVLEEANYDLLDAMIILERQGKVKAPQTESYTTKNEENVNTEFESAQRTYQNDCKKSSVGQLIDKILATCGKLLKASLDSSFVVTHKGNEIINVPVLVLIICLIAFAITVPLLIIGLFCDFRYRIDGVDKVNVNFDINGTLNNVSDTCDNIKKDLTK
ncbi:MAG: UBA/TS-N domain protein [Lachnospiraceae bacterium]|nr:UBA/TS-N domain protein [Lachnospiraceae bacterium]